MLLTFIPCQHGILPAHKVVVLGSWLWQWIRQASLLCYVEYIELINEDIQRPEVDSYMMRNKCKHIVVRGTLEECDAEYWTLFKVDWSVALSLEMLLQIVQAPACGINFFKKQRPVVC